MKRDRISIEDICEVLDTDYTVFGEKTAYILTASSIHNADKNSISFVSDKNPAALEVIRNSGASVIVCSNQLKPSPADYDGKTLISVENPRLAFIRIMNRFFKPEVKPGIHQTAVVDNEAEIGEGVTIGPFCYVGKCTIGDGTVLISHIRISDKIVIGRNVIIETGVDIGSTGLGYERNDKGELEKFPQLGGVIIEDDVEIGANSSIVRGTLENTIIRTGTKIGGLCRIGHNSDVGKHCLILAQDLIGGGAKIGDNCWIAPQVCIKDGIEIGTNVVVGMGSVVTASIEDGWTVFGVPAKKVRRNNK